MKRVLIILLTALNLVSFAQDIERERPAEWAGVVEGGRFRDHFFPMRGEEMRSDIWGADCVIPRLVDNGVEDDIFSYWGGNIYKEGDKYHLFVCAWLEKSPDGHRTWPRSVVCHTVSSSMSGPFTNLEMIGFGHNPELYRSKDGGYVIACNTNRQPIYYYSKSLEGKWQQRPFLMNDRGRGLIESFTNLTFAPRADGSILMVCRGGGIWISRNGTDEFKQISTHSVYPDREGRFEDPVVWRDDVQYHLIVNDWYGRVAYYLRSADGVNWVEDCGEAYTPGIALHEDGTMEDWYKFERMKIFQDEDLRAVQANFAVCDTLKIEDIGDDRHSSKNITIPLNRALLMEIVEDTITPKMRTISLRIKGEDDFDPHTELDIESLRFGLSSDVNYGRGCTVKRVESSGKDAIVVFNTSGYTIPDSEFAPKLLGRNKQGKIVYGYAHNPNVDCQPAILTCTCPVQDGANTLITVDNLGLKRSSKAKLKLSFGDKSMEYDLRELDPYESQEITIKDFTIDPQALCQADIVTIDGNIITSELLN
ncbi:MAG: glycoside hydrolase family protein [Rikenellaceae bacterium]